MAQDRDIFDKAGQFNLAECRILSYRHDNEKLPISIDILGILVNFEIREDILTNNVMGRIVVYDMQDIRTVLPITGLERLSLKFNSPGISGYDYSDVTGVPLQIYKIDSVQEDPKQTKAQGYIIYFCSPEMYRNSITKVSKAYAGPVENAINDILRNKLKSTKPFFFEPTATNTKVVIPNLKPYKAITLLAKSAVPSQFPNNSGYCFYETSKGFYFRSIASMLAYNSLGAEITPRWKFASMISSVTEDRKMPQKRDIERRLSSVIRYDYKKPIDVLSNMNEGLYANKVISHNAFNKTITVTDFDYIKEGKKQPHNEMRGEAGLLYPEGVEYADTRKPLNEHFDSKVMVNTNTTKRHNDYRDVKSSKLGIRISHQQSMLNHNLTLLVYGNTLLNAGDVVIFTQQVKKPQNSETDEGLNNYTSGRYLIVAIKHIVNISAQRHEMVLECQKDSVRSAFPTEEEALSNIGQDNTSKLNIYNEQLKEFEGDVYT